MEYMIISSAMMDTLGLILIILGVSYVVFFSLLVLLFLIDVW